MYITQIFTKFLHSLFHDINFAAVFERATKSFESSDKFHTFAGLIFLLKTKIKATLSRVKL